MIKESMYYKIMVSVPIANADDIRMAINDAGGSRQGNYDLASMSYRVVGRFRPLKGAKPHIGRQGKIEKVKEESIEVLCHKDYLEKVIKAIKRVHPYEEPVIDIIRRYEV